MAKTSARDVLYGLTALESWEEYRAFMNWERARFGMSPINDAQLAHFRSMMGDPPRVNAKAWDSYRDLRTHAVR